MESNNNLIQEMNNITMEDEEEGKLTIGELEGIRGSELFNRYDIKTMFW